MQFIADGDKKQLTDLPNGLTENSQKGVQNGAFGSSAQDFVVQKKQLKHEPKETQGASSDLNNENSSINPLGPEELIQRLGFVLPEEGLGKAGLIEILEKLLRYSVNTWNQGFLHKLYATTNPIGVVSELILAVLNTSVCISSKQKTRDWEIFPRSFLPMLSRTNACCEPIASRLQGLAGPIGH